MIKTLRITSIIAAITAGVLLVCAVVFGMRKDPRVENYLKQPGAVEKLAADGGKGAARDEAQVSPLVKEAVDFSRYLSPLPPVAPAAPPVTTYAAAPAPPAPVSAKFELVGTSFYADKPELSLALIDEPGQGLHWVRQGSSVGRLIIEKVSDGSITVRDGDRQFDMSVTVKELWRDLVKGTGSSGVIRDDSETGRISSSSPQQLPTAPVSSKPTLPGRREIPPRRGRDTITRTPTMAGRLSTEAHPAPKITPAATELPDKAQSLPETAVESGPEPEPPLSIKEMLRRRLMDKNITPEEARRIEELAKNLEQIEAAQSAAQDQNSPSE